MSGVSSGTFNLNGGTLLAPSVGKYATNLTSAVFNFNGGTLKAVTSTTTWFGGGNLGWAKPLDAANVQAGGARIDTDVYDDTITQPLLHDAALGDTRDGGLTKLGTGTLTLISASTYTGNTTVADGMLKVGNVLCHSLGTGQRRRGRQRHTGRQWPEPLDQRAQWQRHG